MSTAAKMLRYRVADRVAWVSLDRPDKLNAMPTSFWAELVEVLDRAEADNDVRVLVFRGEGRCFSVGGDIGTFAGMDTVRARREFSTECLEALRRVERLAKPTIAAVHGFAFGGGCELTMVCDLVVADATAVFATPEAGVGLFPALAVVRGRAHTSTHMLKYLAFTGERLDAEQARTAGLVNIVTGEGGHVAEAERLATLMVEKAPLALAMAKRVIDRGSEDGYAHSIDAISLAHGSADQAEGVSAFVDRRRPTFEGT